MYLLSFIEMTVPIRIFMFVSGFIILCKVQAAYFVSGMPLMPFDAFVADLVHYTDTNVFKVKTMQDMTFLISAVVLSLCYFHTLIGVGIGTILIAFMTGFLQQKTVDYLNRNFKFETCTEIGLKLQQMAKIEKRQ